MSKERAVAHQFEGEQLESVFVGRRDGQARPTVILIPTVMGVSDLEIGFGRQLSSSATTRLSPTCSAGNFAEPKRDMCFGEMKRLAADRPALRRRLTHVLDLVRGIDGSKGAKSSSPAIASAGCARSISRGAGPTSPRRSASTACSTRPACRRRRSRPRSLLSTAGTTRWSRRTRSSRSARS